MKHILLPLFTIMVLITKAQLADWKALGVDDYNQASCGAVTQLNSFFTIAPNGTAYLAFADGASTNHLSVRSYVNGLWSYVGGTTAISLGDITSPSLAFDNTGNPYVCFQDNGNPGYGLTVKKFNGTNWITVGSSNFGTAFSGKTAMVIDGTGAPVVLYRDGTTNINKCVKWNGSSWSNLGSPPFTSGSNWNQMAQDANGIIYVKYENRIAKYDGINWSHLPTTTNVTWPAFTLDANGQPWIVFDSANVSKIYCRYYNGTNWVSPSGGVVDTYTNTNIHSTSPKITVGANNVVYVAYAKSPNNSTTRKIYLKSYNGSVWSTYSTGNPAIADISIPYLYLGIDAGNKVYTGAYPWSYNSHALIYSSTGTSWNLCGNKDITNSTLEASLSMDIASNGTPYIIGSGGTNGLISAWKYNGNTWDTVGVRGFTTGTTPLIRISNTNTPYTMYLAGFPSPKIFAHKFNGASWVSIPQPTNALMVGAFDFEFTSTDTLYCAVTDNVYRVFVYKFNGNTWSQVGSAVTGTLNNNGSSGQMDLAFDKNNVPYVAFKRGGSNYAMAIVSFTNGSWQSLTDFTTSASACPANPNLAFDANNTLYLGCSADLNPSGGKAIVRKYNSGNWQVVGTPSVSPGPADNLIMALDSLDNPWIAYIDRSSVLSASGFAKVSVQKFNGTFWAYANTQAISSCSAITCQMQQSPGNKRMHLGYLINNYNNSVGQIWVKEYAFASVTSINENKISVPEKKLLLYPNPVKDHLYFNAEQLNTNLVCNITIFSASGQKIYSGNQHNAESPISISGLPAGFYILTVENDKETYRGKFLKE